MISHISLDGAIPCWNTQFGKKLISLAHSMSELPESRVKSASLDPKKKMEAPLLASLPLSGPACMDRGLCLGPQHTIALPQEKHLFLYFYLKKKLILKKRLGGVAALERVGAASRSGCFQGANLSISSQLVGGRGRNPCLVVAAAVTTAALSLLCGVGVCPKGVVSLLSLSGQLFNWPGCISAAEPGPSLSLGSLGSLLVSLGKRQELFLIYSLGSAPAVSVFQKLWDDPFCVTAVPYTSLSQGNSLLPRALLSN